MQRCSFSLRYVVLFFFFFFFQAEDGIRDLTVTGVQTCALPIYSSVFICVHPRSSAVHSSSLRLCVRCIAVLNKTRLPHLLQIGRASCREECRSRCSPYH